MGHQFDMKGKRVIIKDQHIRETNATEQNQDKGNNYRKWKTQMF